MDILIGIGRMLVYSDRGIYAMSWIIVGMATMMFFMAVSMTNPNSLEIAGRLMLYLILDFINWVFIAFTLFVVIINMAELKSMEFVRVRDLGFGAWQAVSLLSMALAVIRTVRYYVKTFTAVRQ